MGKAHHCPMVSAAPTTVVQIAGDGKDHMSGPRPLIVVSSGARITKMTFFIAYVVPGMGWLGQVETSYGLNVCPLPHTHPTPKNSYVEALTPVWLHLKMGLLRK